MIFHQRFWISTDLKIQIRLALHSGGLGKLKPSEYVMYSINTYVLVVVEPANNIDYI